MLEPDLLAVTIYLIAMFALWGYAAMLAVAWAYRRTPMIGALAMFMFFVGVGAMGRVLTRSPQSLVPDDLAFWLQRFAVVMEVLTGFGVVDAYLAETNAHLSLLRRIWYWWDRRRSARAETQRG
jgi:hypothetical protein